VLLANLLLDIGEEEVAARLKQAGGKKRPRKKPEEADENIFRLSGADSAARRLRFPNVREVVRLVEDLLRLKYLNRMKNPHARAEAILMDGERKEILLSFYEVFSETAGRRKIDLRRILAKAAERPAFMSGKRLIELGIGAGPAIAAILEEVREAEITGRISNCKEAEEMAMLLGVQ
jgi:hypothetical protein